MTRLPNTRVRREQLKERLRAVQDEEKLRKLLYEAYLAGWNKEMAGFWRHPSTLQTTGEPHTLAQMWAQHKTES